MNHIRLRVLIILRRLCLILSNIFAAWMYLVITLYVLLPAVPYVHVNALLIYRTASCVYLGRSGFVSYGYYRDCPFLRLINPVTMKAYDR